MNNVSLVGRLTKDPELRHVGDKQTAFASFTLAVDRRFKTEGQPTADFIPIVLWGKTAEFVSNYFTKGLRVFVVGSIQTRNWTDQDGKKHYVTEVKADQVGFADGKQGAIGDFAGGSDANNAADDDYDLPF